MIEHFYRLSITNIGTYILFKSLVIVQLKYQLLEIHLNPNRKSSPNLIYLSIIESLGKSQPYYQIQLQSIMLIIGMKYTLKDQTSISQHQSQDSIQILKVGTNYPFHPFLILKQSRRPNLFTCSPCSHLLHNTTLSDPVIPL